MSNSLVKAVKEAEDRVEVELPTLGGVQKVVFFTPSGTLQVLTTGQLAFESARRLLEGGCQSEAPNA